MDGKEDNDEAADEQQRMEGTLAVGLDEPGDEGLHLARRVEGRGGLEDDADLFAIGIKGADGDLEVALAAAAMALILRAVAQEVLWELANHVLRDGDLLEGIKHLIHDIGVTGHLLLIPCLKLSDMQAAQQVLDLTVGEPGSLNARGRANTLNGGDLAQRREFLR